MSTLRRALALLLLSAVSHAGSGVAQTVNSENRVVTVVIAKVPPGVPRAKLNDGIAASVPTYQKIPGLLAKFFTVNDDTYGGAYLWKDRAAAEAWFTPELVARIKARSGIDPQIIYYDSPVQIDNRTAAR